MNKKSIIVSGYFNPLHKGHLEYLNEAKKIADKLIVIVKKDYEVAFANGGDQTNETIPEVAVCEELGVTLIDGLGEKIQSSSWLIK
mgnify:CR=1 FL=1